MRNSIVLLFSVYTIVFAGNKVIQKEEKDFFTSFINNYGFTHSSRITHEYHPFILSKTRNSFTHLEDCLRQQSIAIEGRIVICGFQADAVPSYYTFDDYDALRDEKQERTKAGFPLASENLFGYFTGFLLKNIKSSCSLSYKDRERSKTQFHYVGGESVGLFDERATLFHKHAFGDGYQLIRSFKNYIKKALVAHDAKELLRVLHEFWRCLYVRNIRDGQRKLVATQDILFSLYYAQYLARSAAPITHFIVGPDITYPIEILPCQKAQATQAAQNFLPYFSSLLQNTGNEPTAYIFCSFIDGVGKSTLLGNIKNWIRHGNNFSAYQREDNASSQRASFFEYKENIWLVDLPAQTSHFISKPDGYVYVDIETVQAIGASERKRIQQYVLDNTASLIRKFQVLLEQRRLKKNIPTNDSSVASIEELYAHQCIMFDAIKNQWVAFSYEGKSYLFDRTMPYTLKILQPLEKVHSYGLKEASPEQMIFSKGLSIAMSYDFFLRELTQNLKDRGIKKIVFVDFMSMYPRSSREAIRVNFTLQHLKYLFGAEYDIQQTVYKKIVHPQEVYKLLSQHSQDAVKCFMRESAVRFIFQQILEKHVSPTITVLDNNQIKKIIKDCYDRVIKEYSKHINDLVHNKIMLERDELAKQYEYDKDFQALVCFDPAALIRFSLYLCTVFTQYIKDPYINMLWSDACKAHGYEVVYSFDPECRDPLMLSQVLRFIRVHWYQSLANLFKVNEQWCLESQPLCVPPVVVMQSTTGLIQVLRKRMPLVDSSQELLQSYILSRAHIQFWSEFPVHWALFDNKLHPIDNQKQATHNNIYCYGIDVISGRPSPVSALINDLKTQPHFFVSTSALAHFLQQNNQWQNVMCSLGLLHAVEQLDVCSAVEPTRLAIRSLATLEMIAQDPNSSCMVRRGNKNDFSAALLLFERLTLPAYTNYCSKKNLFDAYDSVEPVIAGLC